MKSQHLALPYYIKPKHFNYYPANPDIYEKSDAILGIYYNVLYPEELQIEEQNTISTWLRSDEDMFPFTKKKFAQTASFFLGRTPITVFEGLFAEQVLDSLSKGNALDESFNLALEWITTHVVPNYQRKARVVQELLVKERHPLVKERYQIMYGALEKCIQDPENELSYSKQTYIDHKHQLNFYSLLEAAVQKGQKLILPVNNRWDRRILAIRETIKKTMAFAPNAPYFLALQEVTPRALEDLKKQFPDLQWISYNTTTAKETRVQGEEEVLGEFLSFTATLALSSELQIIRIDHATLPSVSGSLRRILGVEVYQSKLKRHLAIFTLHTDYLVKDHLYERNVKVISEFVQKFAGQLPFIFGGDLNAFERLGGEGYIQSLKTSKAFEGSIDYREGPFYSSPAIAYSTFIGHVLDSFKESLIEANGSLIVHPNALDHIFLKKLKIIFSLREAGVFKDDGHVIDAFLDPETYLEHLNQRHTASDHFLNAVLFGFE